MCECAIGIAQLVLRVDEPCAVRARFLRDVNQRFQDAESSSRY